MLDIFDGTCFVLPYLVLAGLLALVGAVLLEAGTLVSVGVVAALYVRRAYLAAGAAGVGATASALGIFLATFLR